MNKNQGFRKVLSMECVYGISNIVIISVPGVGFFVGLAVAYKYKLNILNFINNEKIR